MTKEEYIKKQKELDSEFYSKKEELMKEFVRSNNPHKIGDKVTDHMGTIIIETMSYDWGFDNTPNAVYRGVELTKGGTPSIKQYNRSVYQSNLIK